MNLFFTAASPRYIIPHSHHSPFPIADSQGRGRAGWNNPYDISSLLHG